MKIIRRLAVLAGSAALLAGVAAPAATAATTMRAASAAACGINDDYGTGAGLVNNGHNTQITTTPYPGGTCAALELLGNGYYQVEFISADLCATYNDGNGEAESESCTLHSSNEWVWTANDVLENVQAMDLGQPSGLTDSGACDGIANVTVAGGGIRCQIVWNYG